MKAYDQLALAIEAEVPRRYIDSPVKAANASIQLLATHQQSNWLQRVRGKIGRWSMGCWLMLPIESLRLHLHAIRTIRYRAASGVRLTKWASKLDGMKGLLCSFYWGQWSIRGSETIGEGRRKVSRSHKGDGSYCLPWCWLRLWCRFVAPLSRLTFLMGRVTFRYCRHLPLFFL